MAYATYDFYTEKYYGDVIPDESFDKYADRASDRIDQYTFDRCVGMFTDDERSLVKIKKACCAIADALYQIDEARKASMNNVGTITREDGTVVQKAIKSVSAGNESITYATDTSGNIYTKASVDKKTEHELIGQIITEHLQGVTDKNGICLLYGGF